MTSVLSMTPRLSSDESTRPICASVWVRNPAKTSCWRAYSCRSSADRSLHACTQLGPRCRHRALGHHPAGHLALEDLGPPGVPPLVEDAPVGVDPLGRHVVRRVHGAEGEVQEEGLARRRLLLVLDHAHGLVGQVLAQVVALLGAARRVDGVVVADQVGRPVVGVALEEAVVPLEAEAERPGVEGPGGGPLPAGRQVPLADGQRRVPGVAQQAGQGGGRLRDPGRVAGERRAGCRPGSPCRRRGGCAR